MASIVHFPRQRVVTNSIRALPGAKCYLFEAGTTTALVSYSDSALTTPQTHPVSADAYGVFPPMYLADTVTTYKVRLTNASGTEIWTEDNVPVAGGSSVAPPSGGGGSWPITQDEIDNSITVVDEGYPPFDVRRYGAAESAVATVNTGAIQSALNLAYAVGGGTVVLGPGDEYEINGALVMGSFTNLDGRGGQLTQLAANTPIVKMTKAAFNQNLTVRDIRLHYDAVEPATNTNSAAIMLAEENKFSWAILLENVKIRYAAIGVYLPPATGGSAFLVHMTNVVASDCSYWGFLIEGDPAGANTNYTLDTCWVIQSVPDEISTSCGFAIKRTHGFRMDSCGADHVQNRDILYVETSQGSIGTFWAESCDIYATGYGHAFFTFSNSKVDASYIYLVGNVVTLVDGATFFAVRTMDGSNIHIHILHDIETTFLAGPGSGLGRVRSAVYCDSISTLTNDIFSSGTGIGIGGGKLGYITDFNNEVGVKRWNGVSLEYNVCDIAHGNAFALGGMDANPLSISMRWSKEGQTATIRWGYNISGTGQGTHIGIGTLPTVIRPKVTQRSIAFIYCEDASPYQRLGMVEIQTSGEIRIYKDLEGNVFPGSTTCGILDTVITYSLVGDVAPDEVL